MGQCKCRQCGMLSSAKAWSASKEPACPHCGHGQFSISFQSAGPAVPSAVPEVQGGHVDALGRHRKIIRLESFSGAASSAATKPSFRERMQALKTQAGKSEQKDD